MRTISSKKFIQNYIVELKRCLDNLDISKVEEVVDILMTAYQKKKQIFILGNGGGASTASHMACDLGKGTLQRIYDNTEERLRVISLTDNAALMTALANDLSFDDVFVQQLRNLVKKNDVVIALSGSGNSPNVLKALEYAKECGATTIGFLGFKTGGKAGKMVDCAVIVDTNHYGPIEDIQLILDHILTAWIARVKYLSDGSAENINSAVPFKI